MIEFIPILPLNIAFVSAIVVVVIATVRNSYY